MFNILFKNNIIHCFYAQGRHISITAEHFDSRAPEIVRKKIVDDAGNVRVLVEDNRMKCKRCRIFYKSELGPNSGIRTYR